ncbi:MAG TPA: amidohydrolase family protein [Solirubrobacteraceae bacterium]
MIEDVFVIDGVAHSYNLQDDNFYDPQVRDKLRKYLYGCHTSCVPPEYWMPEEQFRRGEDPDLIASALFAESQTDYAAYHHTPLYGFQRDGGSALWVGEEMKRRWPDRTMIYGASAPNRPDAVEYVDELIDGHGAAALKLYPVDIVDGTLQSLNMGDEDVCFPVFEHARSRGINVIAVHKAIPLGAAPVEAMRGADVEAAAIAFPDLKFEIVHGGLAFLDETALELMCFPNIYVNLECTSALATMAPMRLLHVLGALLAAGGEDRIVWATGCDFAHPRPLIEAFWNLEMTDSLREGYGYPELTREIKKKILGLNFARMHGLEVEQLKQATVGDEFSVRTSLARPWSRASRELAGREREK